MRSVFLVGFMAVRQEHGGPRLWPRISACPSSTSTSESRRHAGGASPSSLPARRGRLSRPRGRGARRRSRPGEPPCRHRRRRAVLTATTSTRCARRAGSSTSPSPSTPRMARAAASSRGPAGLARPEPRFARSTTAPAGYRRAHSRSNRRLLRSPTSSRAASPRLLAAIERFPPRSSARPAHSRPSASAATRSSSSAAALIARRPGRCRLAQTLQPRRHRQPTKTSRRFTPTRSGQPRRRRLRGRPGHRARRARRASRSTSLPRARAAHRRRPRSQLGHRRARRRRGRRPRRLRRRDALPRHSRRAGADDAGRHDRLGDRRQDRRSTPRPARTSSAPSGSRRGGRRSRTCSPPCRSASAAPRSASCEVRAARRRGDVAARSMPPGPGAYAAARPGLGDDVAAHRAPVRVSRPRSSAPTSASAACARCSTSATRSATRSRPAPGYGTLLHGEAVALGLVAAARVSAAPRAPRPGARVRAALRRTGLDADLDPG